MRYFIDRRANAKNKSTVNRQRFLQRYRSHIKRSVEEAVNRRSITDMEHGEKVSNLTKDISEPVFQHGPGGSRTIVSSGNQEFVEGDRDEMLTISAIHDERGYRRYQWPLPGDAPGGD